MGGEERSRWSRLRLRSCLVFTCIIVFSFMHLPVQILGPQPRTASSTTTATTTTTTDRDDWLIQRLPVVQKVHRSEHGYVQRWLSQRLGHSTKFMLYASTPGSGGLSSWRTELVAALLISELLGYTLVLREDHVTTRALQLCYDIAVMRFEQVDTLGFTFIWMHEIRAKGIQVFADGHGCAEVKVVHPRLNLMAESLSLIVDANVDAYGLMPWNHHCMYLPTVDGGVGWSLTHVGCQLSKTCIAFYRSFHLHPEVRETIASLKQGLTRLTNRETYMCYHMNPSYFCDAIIPYDQARGWGHFNANELQPWQACMSRCMQMALSDTAAVSLLSRTRNILIVSQSDTMIVPILKNTLNNQSMKVFTLEDLGAGKIPFETHGVWGDPGYIRRSAASWGLCSPEHAASYIGEGNSGFSMTMLTEVRINPPGKGYEVLMRNAFPIGCK